MQRAPLFMVALACAAPGLAQVAPAITWQQAFGGTAKETAISITATADGGCIVAGASYSDDGDVEDNNGSGDVWLLKLDAVGTLQWEKNYGGTSVDAARDVIQTSDGGYLVTAFSSSANGDVPLNLGEQDVWVLKLNAQGSIEWQVVRGGSEQEQPFTASETADGYLIGGATASTDGDIVGNHGSWDFWVFKLDLNGNFLWQRCYGGTDGEQLYDAQALGDGGFILAGAAWSNDGDVTMYGVNSDLWLVRIDADGDILWQRCYGGTMARSVRATSDGGFLACGETTSDDGMVTGHHGQEDLWVIKVDSLGTLQWQRAIGGSTVDMFGQAVQLPDGRYAVVAEGWSTDGDFTGNNGLADVMVVMLDAGGNLQWHMNLGGSGHDRGRAMTIGDDGAVMLAATTNSSDGDVTGYHLPYSLNNDDYWVVKLNTDAMSTPEPGAPAVQLAPNPASDVLVLSADPTMLGARYTVTDPMGRVLRNASIQAARTPVDVMALPAGVYLLTISTPDGTTTLRWVKE